MSYDFETVKAAFNIRDEVIRVLGEPLDTCHQYDSFMCPFHAEKTAGAFVVYDDHYYCYSCEANGDVLDFFAWAQGKSLTEIMKENDLDFTPEQLIERKEEIATIKLEAKQKADGEYVDALDKLHRAKAWVSYHDNLTDITRKIWRDRGVSDVWQDLWGLGYRDSFTYNTKTGKVTSPTITIPLVAIGGEVLNVRHRILNAMDGDKYRPERSGLRAHPFICNTDLEKGTQDLIIVEGEIKSMVVYQTYDKPGTQVIGVPSKSMMRKSVQQAKGRNVIVIPDPDDDTVYSGCRVLKVPQKIDDMILEYGLDKSWLRNAAKQARKI